MTVLHSTVGVIVAMDIPNPFDGVTPSLGPFQAALGPKITILLALVWFGAIVAACIYLALGIGEFSQHKRANRPEGISSGAAGIAVPLGGLVGLAILPFIVGAAIS